MSKVSLPTQTKNAPSTSMQGLVKKFNQILLELNDIQIAKPAMIEIFQQLFPHSSGFISFSEENTSVYHTLIEWGIQGMARPYFLAEDCPALLLGKEVLSTRETTPPKHLSKRLNHMRYTAPLKCGGKFIGVLGLHFDPSQKQITPAQFQNWIQNLSWILPNLALYWHNKQSTELLALHRIRDPQTQLYNRKFFEETLQLELSKHLRTEIPVSFILIYLDDLNQLEKKHSPAAVDLLIWQLANHLPNVVRAEDVLCRYGKSSFAILLPTAPLKAAHHRAKILQEQLEVIRVVHQEKNLETTVSLAFFNAPKHGTTAAHLLGQADLKLEEDLCKGLGRKILSPESEDFSLDSLQIDLED